MPADAGARADVEPDGSAPYRAALLDWMACAVRGRSEPAGAKFSIPYTTAYTLLRGGPRVEAFDALDEGARELAARIEVRTDPALGESEFALLAGGEELARVDAARGSPEHPLAAEELRAKVRDLAGERLDGVLDDGARPAAELLATL